MAKYAVLMDSTERWLVVMTTTKTEPLDADWSQADILLCEGGFIKAVAAFDPEGDGFYIVTQMSSGRVSFHYFHIGIGSFIVGNEKVAAVGDHVDFLSPPVNPACAITVLSNGDIGVIFNGHNDRWNEADEDDQFRVSNIGSGWETVRTVSRESTDIILSGPNGLDETLYAYRNRPADAILCKSMTAAFTQGATTDLVTNIDTAARIIGIPADDGVSAFVPYISAVDDISVAEILITDPLTQTIHSGVSTEPVYGHGRTTPPWLAFACVNIFDMIKLLYVDEAQKKIRCIEDITARDAATDVITTTGSIDGLSACPNGWGIDILYNEGVPKWGRREQDTIFHGVKVWFTGDRIFRSDEIAWRDMPETGLLIIMAYYKEMGGHNEYIRQIFNSHDYYALDLENLAIIMGDGIRQEFADANPGLVIKDGEEIDTAEFEALVAEAMADYTW